MYVHIVCIHVDADLCLDVSIIVRMGEPDLRTVPMPPRRYWPSFILSAAEALIVSVNPRHYYRPFIFIYRSSVFGFAVLSTDRSQSFEAIIHGPFPFIEYAIHRKQWSFVGRRLAVHRRVL